MTFEQYCSHMYAENCHERREYGQKEYTSMEDYVASGTNKKFLLEAFEDGRTEQIKDNPLNWIS